MMDTEAFREFKTGLTLLRDNYAMKALPHMRRAVDLDKNNPYYMSYLGVVLARSERKWGEAERHASPVSCAQLPWPQEPPQPAARNLKTSRDAPVRAGGVLNSSLHPQTQERASQSSGAPVLAFIGWFEWPRVLR